MQLRIIIIVMLSLVSVAAVAQKKKRKKDQGGDQPTSVEPGLPASDQYKPKVKNNVSKKKIEYSDPQRDVAERLAAADKKRRKNEKLQETPQYSDPTYFGHKRPPKKHKPGHMKFCKVCGIRH